MDLTPVGIGDYVTFMEMRFDGSRVERTGQIVAEDRTWFSRKFHVLVEGGYIVIKNSKFVHRNTAHYERNLAQVRRQKVQRL